MKPRPVRRYRSPVYPTRLEALKDPRLLESCAPAVWRRYAIGLAALALPLEGCIFIQGKPAPPSYISEEEALEIIKDEMADYGFRLEEGGAVLTASDLPPPPENPYQNRGEETGRLFKVEKLRVDLADRRRRVAVEYLADGNWRSKDRGTLHLRFGSVDTPLFSSVKDEKTGESFLLGVIEERSRCHECELRRSEGSLANQETELSPKDKCRELCRARLREQVKDFVDWLKAQGVL